MTNNVDRYIVATIKAWHIEQYQQYNNNIIGNWNLITKKEELNLENLRRIKPKYIFFPHWSWLVPEEILKEFTCICFHMTDVPYGRGGSPLQNLIVREHQNTQLSALKMTAELDAGPVYLKCPLSLDGSAQEIFIRSAELTAQMIASIIALAPTPIKQVGKITIFERKTAEESEIQGNETIKKLYDLIRMLDAETYPKAFLHYGDLTLHFEKACLNTEVLNATVTITKRDVNIHD